MIVEKFRPTIPEGRLVLVALENELFPAAKPIAFAEVFSHAADQKIRALTGTMKNPRQHGGSGGFAVSATDHNGMALRQKNLFENFRHRTVHQLAVQHFFQLRIPARNDISDYHEIWRRLQVRRIKIVVERNS